MWRHWCGNYHNVATRLCLPDGPCSETPPYQQHLRCQVTFCPRPLVFAPDNHCIQVNNHIDRLPSFEQKISDKEKGLAQVMVAHNSNFNQLSVNKRQTMFVCFRSCFPPVFKSDRPLAIRKVAQAPFAALAAAGPTSQVALNMFNTPQPPLFKHLCAPSASLFRLAQGADGICNVSPSTLSTARSCAQ